MNALARAVAVVGVATLAGTSAAGPARTLTLWPADPPATQPYEATDRKSYRPDEPDVFSIANIVHPTITVYRPEGAPPAGRAWPAVVVCPGGGYAAENVVTAGTRVAERLAGSGVVACVLRYRLPNGRPPGEGELPAPQQDVLRAVQLVRARAAELGVDPGRVGVIGFSAGGHMAATAATLYEQAGTLADQAGHDATSKLSARPDFAVLVYPVVTMAYARTHAQSRRNLLGPDADAALEARFSAERHVTPNTPPLLIVHAADDATVPVDHALLLAAAAAEQRVPCELVLLKKGGHGFGLGRADAETGQWFERMLRWMDARGVRRGAG